MMIITPIQIRFADVDRMRHVNNVVLNHYFDLGRTDYLEQVLGNELDWQGKTAVIVRIENDFLSQVRIGDVVEVHTHMESMGNKSFRMAQELVDGNGEVKVKSVCILSTYDVKTEKSYPIPNQWKEIISRFENQCSK